MSTVILLAVMAGWVVVGTYGAWRWQGIRPPDIDHLEPGERWPAVQAFLGMQAHANVNRWRRTIVTGGLVLIVLVWGVVEDERRDTQRVEDACRTRADGRADVRSAIVDDKAELLDAVADEFDVTITETQRARIIDRSAARVAAALPAPEC